MSEERRRSDFMLGSLLSCSELTLFFIYDSRCHICATTFRIVRPDGLTGGSAMEFKRYFLEQLESEAAASRKAIERVPEGQNGWKPHEKSMELGKLAALVATMPGWVAVMIDHDELDLNGNGKAFQ